MICCLIRKENLRTKVDRLNWPQFIAFKATNLSEGGSDNSNPSQIPLETRSLITHCILQNVHNKTYILYYRLMLQSTVFYTVGS